VKLKRTINLTKDKKTTKKNKDQIGQYNISQLGLKNVIEKSSEFYKKIIKKKKLEIKGLKTEIDILTN
jgi:hypothetical protein